jgi:hypothetical protein
MPNFSRAEIAQMRAARSLRTETPPDPTQYRLSEDVWEAREQRDYWRERTQLYQSEFERLRKLLREAGHPELAEAPSFYCAIPGCRREAGIGSKICDSEDEHPDDANLLIQICFVRSCENERIHPMTPFCDSHKATYRSYAFSGDHDELTADEFMKGLVTERFYHEPDDNDDEDRSPPARVSHGPPAPIPGLGDQVTTHGLPAHIETANVGEALSRGETSTLEASPPKCVYGQCSEPRATGHAFCESHLASLR